MQPTATRHRIRDGRDAGNLVCYVIANVHQEDAIQKLPVS